MEIFIVVIMGESRQREETKLNMAGRLNQTMKRRVGRAREESPRGVSWT